MGTRRRWCMVSKYSPSQRRERHSFLITATLFPRYIGEGFIAFTQLSCKFLKEVHAGDTLYSTLEIIDLARERENGIVTTGVTVFNQKGELVLSGWHKYLLKAG